MCKGSCNIALSSYVHSDTGVATSASQWSSVFDAGLQLIMECIVSHGVGGSAIISSKSLYIRI